MVSIMSTIASPRPSISASSRRTSTSTDTPSTTAHHAAQPSVDRGSLRRNRAALRDYYNLAATSTPPKASLEIESPIAETSELDEPDFDAQAYVQSLLAREGLEGVLKVEAGLVSEIRSLDGEKKALVYDNYSKLIAATDTIKSMREKMDPMTPTTSTLTPAIGHIAETAASLSGQLKASRGRSGTVGVDERKRKIQQATVQWVLAAPARLEILIEEEKREEAEDEWREVDRLLGKWEGVRGVEEVRKACLAALEAEAEDEAEDG